MQTEIHDMCSNHVYPHSQPPRPNIYKLCVNNVKNQTHSFANKRISGPLAVRLQTFRIFFRNKEDTAKYSNN